MIGLKEDLSLDTCLFRRKDEKPPTVGCGCMFSVLHLWVCWKKKIQSLYIAEHRGLDRKHGLGNFFFIEDSDFSFSLYLGLVSLPVTLDVSVEVCM